MTRTAGTPDSAATVPSMPGVIAGRYSIGRELGRGAMGRVFAAHDAKLDRDVAIKVLAPGARGEEELRRFEQEARAAGSLNHPNVVAVYDIGVHGGEPYIVSELLEGSSLRERLGGKPLSAALAVDLASQLAEGLAAAHDKGVIHRDLKPENLFVTKGGRLKILDFGIAKLTRAAAAGPQTDTGTVMGTVGYMSPEQVRGEHVDARSDLFSFGCILYEMLAGRAPFDRPSTMETGSAILHDEPPQAVPREIDPVVRRCLEKDPARRYPSAHDLLLALARVRPPGAPRWRWVVGALTLAALIAAGLLVPRLRAGIDAKGARSIAVLPFVNMSSDKETEYFSDGITEELINALANIDGLRVASRTAVFALRGQNLEVQRIGDKLNVNTLLEGSVRREGNALRVTAQLINVSDGYHLWSQSYDRELKSVFALEDEIARSIAQALRHKLLRSGVKPSTTSQEAHDLYLKGRYFWNKRSPEALRQALSYFQQAIDKDPSYALAYVGLADAIATRVDFDGASPVEVLPLAKRAALHALELDPGLAEAHASMGLLAYFDYDWPTALNEFRAAIELKPDYATAHKWYGQALIGIGQLDEGLAELERARQEDPTSLIINNNIAYSHLLARDYQGAVSRLKKNLEMDPGFEMSRFDLASVYLVQGRYDDALAELDKVRQWSSSETETLRARIHARAGRRAEALRVLREMEGRSGRGHVPASRLGKVWLDLGDRDRAFALFAKACSSERDSVLHYLKSDPSFDPIRSDPRFKQLLKCVHLE
jgi:TolB-like protein/Tfp pilus assembly protein PilF